MKKIPLWAWVWIGSAVAVGLAFAIKGKKKASKKPKNILFVGDSITTGSTAYPAIISRLDPTINIDVLSKIGMSTKWMLDNLPEKLKFKKYDRVYIYGGVNDAFGSTPNLSNAVSNVQKMVDLANDSGADAYVILGYKPEGFMDYRKMPTTKYVTTKEAYIPLIQRYGQLQSMYAKDLKRATKLPLIYISGNLTSDGIHPNGEGQKLIAEKVYQTIV